MGAVAWRRVHRAARTSTVTVETNASASRASRRAAQPGASSVVRRMTAAAISSIAVPAPRAAVVGWGASQDNAARSPARRSRARRSARCVARSPTAAVGSQRAVALAPATPRARTGHASTRVRREPARRSAPTAATSRTAAAGSSTAAHAPPARRAGTTARQTSAGRRSGRTDRGVARLLVLHHRAFGFPKQPRGMAGARASAAGWKLGRIRSGHRSRSCVPIPVGVPPLEWTTGISEALLLCAVSVLAASSSYYVNGVGDDIHLRPVITAGGDGVLWRGRVVEWWRKEHDADFRERCGLPCMERPSAPGSGARRVHPRRPKEGAAIGSASAIVGPEQHPAAPAPPRNAGRHFALGQRSSPWKSVSAAGWTSPWTSSPRR
jgi:hypothetical protein